MILWLGSMCFYDTAADPGVDRAKILLPTRITYAMLLADIPSLPIQRIWGGPTTLFGLGSFATSLTVVGTFALALARLSGRPFSKAGAALTLASLPFWFLTFEASGAVVHPTFLHPEPFGRLADFIETRQPGLLAQLRAGSRPSLPRDLGGRIRLHARPGEGRLVTLAGGDGRERPIRDQADAEALRFALAQQAMFAGDRATLRRLLPIDLPMPVSDRTARHDIASRLAALGRSAGVAPVPPEQAAWVSAGEASWRTSIRLVRINRIAIRTLLVFGLVTLLIGQVLKRRVVTIERHSVAAQVGADEVRAPSRPSFGRRRDSAAAQVTVA
ncbi:MAG TPA: hypothetical protein VEW04_00885 [Allosphingosinicella sp.]|nr:hypothetical protein [Allosphingosinicella sp.]